MAKKSKPILPLGFTVQFQDAYEAVVVDDVRMDITALQVCPACGDEESLELEGSISDSSGTRIFATYLCTNENCERSIAVVSRDFAEKVCGVHRTSTSTVGGA